MGTLYLVATPIGNLEDITLRALRVFGEVSLIAAEDTRRARVLAQRYGLHTPITSYFEGNKETKLAPLLEILETADIALISEAGMPGLSDPGYELVRAAIARGIPVVPIPGPSALVTALVVSGLPSDAFVYLGFLPRRPGERRRLLAEVAGEPRTLVAFEAPHRLRASLADMAAAFGERPIAICRELTKVHEEVWRGTISAACVHFGQVEPRGEFTLVVGGAPAAQERWKEERVRAALEELRAQGLPLPEAARQVAAASGWSRDDVYRVGLR